MTEGVAESWARLRLVQGDSTEQSRELGAQDEPVTLTVGSGPSSAWVVRDEGVRPLHFSLHWDGATLRIADTYGAGDVRVDGEPVTAQWRSLTGRVRIAFGKAAIVAETSVADVEPPPAPAPLPPAPESIPAPGGAAQADAGTQLEVVPPQRTHKATLIGVSPLAAATGGEERPASSSPPPGFNVARPGDSERARKVTLLGMAVQLPEATSRPDSSRPEPADGASDAKPSSARKGAMTGTLIGVANPVEMLRGMQREAAEQGVLARGLTSDERQVSDSSKPPSARSDAPGAITQNEVRAVSASPVEGPSRIGSSWQETPDAERVPPAVLLNSSASGSAYIPRGAGEREAGPDAAALDPRDEARPFPWRYVGIGLLTAVAYFAWLYLLDHL